MPDEEVREWSPEERQRFAEELEQIEIQDSEMWVIYPDPDRVLN